MNKAVDDFAAGKAKITWYGDTVLKASRSSDTEITIRLSNNTVNTYKYTADEVRHDYNKNAPAECVSSEIQIERIYLKTEGNSDLVGPITGVYNSYDDQYIKYGTTRIYEDGIAIKSSGSNKMFKITVDDSGTISATEVT